LNRRTENRPESVTIKDVARLADVSLGSVSRVLNEKASVTREVREKVEAAIAELGFRPSAAARTMRSQVSRTVGCIIRDINIPGLAGFVRAAHDVLVEAEYALLLSNSDGRAQRERELLSVMSGRQTDALLIAHYDTSDAQLEELHRTSGMPIILVDRDEPAFADAVMVDHRRAIRSATDRLFQLGHRRIALITGRRTMFPARERIAGFETAHQALGLPLDPSLLRAGSFQADFGFEQTSLLVAAANRPTAIIAGGIEMAPGVIRALRVHGLAIPRDISLVAALDTDLAELHEPPLSVEHWEYAEVGRIAARLALERIAGEGSKAPRRVVVPSNFLLRDSCGPPPKDLTSFARSSHI
jgi:LacI family transcriptional regulator